MLLGPEDTKVSRNGRDPSWSSSSLVNCMCGSFVLICCSSCLLCYASWMTEVSSAYLSHKQGVWGKAKGLDFELFHKGIGNEGADGGTHGSTIDLFIILTLEEEVCAFEAKLQ